MLFVVADAIAIAYYAFSVDRITMMTIFAIAIAVIHIK